MMTKFNALYKKIISESLASSTITEGNDSPEVLAELLKTLEAKLGACTDWHQIFDVYVNYFNPNFSMNGLKRDVKTYDKGFQMIINKITEMPPEPDEFFLENIATDYKKYHEFETIAFRESHRESEFINKLEAVFKPKFDALKTADEKKALFEELSEKYKGIRYYLENFMTASIKFGGGEDSEEWAKTVEITDEIRKKYFVDYGYMNGWTASTSHMYDVACILHERDKAAHPELHQEVGPRRWGRCVHSTRCSCGLEWAVDSSD